MELKAYILVVINADGEKLYWSTSAYFQKEPNTLRIFNGVGSVKALMTKEIKLRERRMEEYPERNYHWDIIQIEEYDLQNPTILRKQEF